MGAIASDDRAPGEVLAQGQTGHGDRAVDGVFRVEREFGHQSHVGPFLEGTKFGDTSNTVGSIDLRYVMPHNWVLGGQATTTHTEEGAGNSYAGPGYRLTLKKSDNHVSFQNWFIDRSPGMNSTLGYIERTDIVPGRPTASILWNRRRTRRSWRTAPPSTAR